VRRRPRGGPVLSRLYERPHDPRRAAYFCLNARGGYGGDDFNVVVNADSVSNSHVCRSRFAPDTRIPYVSYAENELILAEAYAATGDTASARSHLNAEVATVLAAGGGQRFERTACATRS